MLVAEELDVEDEELDFDVEVAEEDAELLPMLVLVLVLVLVLEAGVEEALVVGAEDEAELAVSARDRIQNVRDI